MLNRDAGDARAAVGLVLAQPSISSQLIDNLNASIHLRALLTDLFLIDEIVRPDSNHERNSTLRRELDEKCGLKSRPRLCVFARLIS